MKREYDFSKAERGKFYKRDANLNLPVYLDSQVQDFISGLAEKKHTDLSTVVNELLRSDMQLADVPKVTWGE